MQTIIVFSHLRWDFVFQRPQHLMTRLAQSHRIFFFEEPVFDPGPDRIAISTPAPGVTVCRPHTSLRQPGFSEEQLPALKNLLQELVRSQDIEAPVAWMYTPMALPLLEAIDATAVVYDCMDELSAFLDAPPELLLREAALLKIADVVFTGGPSLYRAKQSRHPNVHCFPSSVQREHFAQALDPSIDHAEQHDIPHPRFGFFGVIDERFDPTSIALLADAHPEWQVVLVGPVVKIDAARLPRRANIHYMGQRSYQELPAFLAGWDVCMLPFAINEATRYISPTKVLEYMAAEKPIVSTPVVDVADPYGHIVHLGRNSQAFVEACERALTESDAGKARRAALMRNVVGSTSWDNTATRMAQLIDEAVKSRSRRVPTQSYAGPAQRRRAVVIGAGPTGLSAAYHLGEGSLLLEQQDRVGGWCRSIEERGFTFDYAGHIMFSNDPYVHDLYGMLLGDNVHWQDREAWIYSKKVYTRYPFQGALYGLPHEVLKECIVGAIEARFGPLKTEGREAPASASSPSACKAESITDCCGDGIAESTLKRPEVRAIAPRNGSAQFANFEDFIYGVWGRGVARHFALPYNRKLWAVPLDEMETSWLGGRVPLPDLEEMIDGALRPVAKPQGPNARFGYPLRGGFQALMNGFLPHLRGDVKLNARVTRIVPSRHLVALSDGTGYVYEKLVSTMPLPKLIEMLGDAAPARIHKAAAQLRHVSVRCVNLGVARPGITDKHWIYYPENSVFHRIFVQGNASPHNNPAGGFGLTCEITYSPHKPLPCDGDALIDRCIADCIDVGILRADDEILVRNQVDMPYAYVVYDHARAEAVDVIRQWLRTRDIELAGRYSEWEYYNSDHAFLAGRKAAERVSDGLAPKHRAPTSREVVAQLLAPATTSAT
jgi:protoporphyrinogen oxidase/glycosyltransferase involved in cell wall biosynthesis